MASVRQIEANRRNAALSTGPRTDEGKAVSRGNAVRHGFRAGSLAEGYATTELERRKAMFRRDYTIETGEATLALDELAIATMQVDAIRYERGRHASELAELAEIAWDVDRAAEAGELFGRIERRPEEVAPRLLTTKHGAELVQAAWAALADRLANGGEWNAEERSLALDLLGVPARLREASAPFDTRPSDARPESWTDEMETARARGFAFEQVKKVGALIRETLAPADAIRRSRAVAGAASMETKHDRLLARYERETLRRYEKSLAILKAGTRGGMARLEAELESEIAAMNAETDEAIARTRPFTGEPADPDEPDEPNDNEIDETEDDRREAREPVSVGQPSLADRFPALIPVKPGKTGSTHRPNRAERRRLARLNRDGR